MYSRLGDWHLERQEFQTAYGYWNRAGQTERILSHLNNPQNFRYELMIFAGADEMFDNTPRNMLFKYPIAYLLHIFYSLIQGKKNAVLGWSERLDELQRTSKSLTASMKLTGTGFWAKLFLSANSHISTIYLK